jgi:predicted unusual protein kinase regulating ubiquinone biosynthesis (AarF/ABC1/UbiB family)
MMGALFATLRAHGLRMRKELTLAVKAITQAEELLRAIQPGMQLVDTATQEAERQLRSELTPERVTSLALSRASAVVQYGLQQAIDGDGEIGAFVASVLMGRTPSAAEASSPDARLLAERIDSIAARMDRAADRSTRVAAVAGVAVSLSLVLAALILRPDVEVDGPVLIVGCLVAAAVGALGLILVRGRGGPPA